MDWNKAKNILIITFIIIDVLLLCSIFINYGIIEPFKESKEEEETLKILKEAGIKVEADIPQETPSMALLRVEFYDYNSKNLVGRILSGGYSEEISGEEHIYRTLTEVLTVAPNGDLYYKSMVPLIFNVSIEEGLLNFLTSKGMAEPGMYIEDVIKQDDTYIVKIAHQIDGYFLDISYIQAKIGPHNIEIIKHWLKPAGYLPQKKKVVPVYKALFNFMSSVSGDGWAAIKDIKLGYYFRWDEAASGEAVPAWRITTEDDVYYFNAYTGELER
ncbi:MAG: two-component system regulatory protein YycI [Thermoanaerobacteraceae bacterium]|nr:two-component system regulatory protein YycI [Thermoanaerobacteraceae bacterium]